MGIKTLQQIVQEYDNSPEVNISLGLRPSGVIHLGNMMTMALAMGLGHEVGPHISKVNVAICDYDLPDENDWDIKANGFAKFYRDLKDQTGVCDSTYAKSRKDIEEFLTNLSKQTSVDFNIRDLSDIQREPSFREGLKKILDSPEAMKLIFPNLKDDSVVVYPVCPKCKTSYTSTIKGKRVTYKDGRIFTHCSNSDCDVKEYDISILDQDAEFSVHMFIDPLRDAVVKPCADVHVFGGDYSQEHGENKLPKIDKIGRLTQIASDGKSPDYLVGPTIYARDGEKMSKTKANGLTSDVLVKHLGDDYPSRVLDFTLGLVNSGFSHVDYPLVDERLLNK